MVPRRQSLRYGPIEVDPPVVLAPMAGVTNVPFRRLCREFGAGLYVNEMVTARALVEGNEKTLRMARFEDGERPRSIQLYGTDPWAIAEATRRLVDDGVDHVDLNFGCPVKKVTRHGGGAALPWKTDLLAAIVTATVGAAGEVPVTIKFRLGIDDDHMTYLDAGRVAEETGCAAVALHARTAEQLYSGDADWTAIAALKNHVRSIPVLGNGDIWEAEDALEMMRSTGCDGVVIGRGCLGRPWLFGELADAFAGRPARTPPTLGEVAAIMARHARHLCEWLGDDRGIRDFRKHTSWYLKGFPVGPELRVRFAKVGSRLELDDHLADLDPSIAFPADAARMVRGHKNGPRPVTVPEGWLEHRHFDGAGLHADAEALVSGG